MSWGREFLFLFEIMQPGVVFLIVCFCYFAKVLLLKMRVVRSEDWGPRMTLNSAGLG